MRYVDHYDSPLGGITLASDGESLVGLWFDGQKYFGSTLGGQYETRKLSVFDDTHVWLDTYFSGKSPDFMPRIKMLGSPFRIQVWEALLQIPYGHVSTYRDIAGEIAMARGIDKMAARAVGGAVGHNCISLIIPCHRVVGVNGNLTGYAGGMERKERLLQLEQQNNILL